MQTNRMQRRVADVQSSGGGAWHEADTDSPCIKMRATLLAQYILNIDEWMEIVINLNR